MPIMATVVACSPWQTSGRPLPTRWMVPASTSACWDAWVAAEAIGVRLRILRLRTSISLNPSLSMMRSSGRPQGAGATLLIAIEIAFLTEI